MTAAPRLPSTYARVTDALDRVESYAAEECWPPRNDAEELSLAVRHLCEALDKLMRNNPVLADVLEKDVADACDAVGVAGP